MSSTPQSISDVTCHSSRDLPPMLRRALGSSSVSGIRRLPCPAPIISAFNARQHPLANEGADRAARFDHMFLKLRTPFSAPPAQPTMLKLPPISAPPPGPPPPVRMTPML